MNKIKLTMLSLAVLLSVGGAFAFRSRQPSWGIYYYNGSQYLPAGTMGLNYTCTTPSANVCTYSYQGFNVYTPYMVDAQYTPIGLKTDNSKPVAKKGN
jgi:hypothetical protein